MHNSLVVRMTIAVLILASGMMGFLINEFLYFGEEFLAGITVASIPAFAIIGARYLRDDERVTRRRNRAIRSAW